MKIIQINCVYEYGSTGKITADIHHELLRQGHESIVCYGRRQKTDEAHVYKICGEFYSHVQHFRANATGILYGGCGIPTHRLISLIKKERPDVVHLQCINGYFVNIYRLVSWLKEHHIRTVLTLHAEFMYTANCGHALDCEKWKTGCGDCPRLKQETGSWFLDRTAASWKRMRKAFEGSWPELTVVSVSPWLRDRAASSPILGAMRHCVVYNGLDTGVFHPRDTVQLRKQYGDAGIIFHATPCFSADPSHLKGGYYVLELAKKLHEKNVKVIVAGPYDPEMEIPENMVMLGRVTDQDLLAQYYSMADVTLLTSKRETFSMVAAESLCCGTPVAGFCAGAPEQIALPEYSRFVPYGDLDGLLDRAEYFLRTEKDSQLPEAAAQKYSTKKMTDAYISCYGHMLI